MVVKISLLLLAFLNPIYGVGLLISFEKPSDVPAVIDTYVEIPAPTPELVAPVTFDSMAIAYLDASEGGYTVWHKDSMEQYPLLKGLYDDLNQFNVDNITGKWKTKLSESKNFAKILESYDKAKKQLGEDFKAEKFYVSYRITYNKDNDFRISVYAYRRYIERIIDRLEVQEKQTFLRETNKKEMKDHSNN